MPSVPRHLWVPLTCAGIAVAASVIAIFPILEAKDMEPSALVRMTVQDPVSRLALEEDPDFVIYRSDHYDGIYMYAIARDPLLRGEAHELIDLPGARYGHPLFAWVSSVLSVGDAGRIPAAMMLLNLISMGGAAALASILSTRFGWSAWGGLVVALNPGLVYAVTVDTSEAFGTMVLAATLLFWVDRRWLLTGVLSLLLCLSKEPFVLVPLTLGAWELFRTRKDGIARALRRIAPLGLGPLALLVWELYLKGVLGYWAFTDSLEVFSLPPLSGWAYTLRLAAAAGDSGDYEMTQIGAATIPILAVTLCVLGVGIVKAARLRGPLDLYFLLLAGLHLCLTWRNLYYMKDLIRQFSTVFLLLPLVWAGYRLRAEGEERSGTSGVGGSTSVAGST